MATDTREILARLNEWEEAERVDRDVARMRRGELTDAELQARWGQDNYYLQIALDPARYPRKVPSEYMLEEGRSVAISKHPRYCPMPLHSHDYFEMNYVVSGGCVQRFEDGVAQLAPGDLCLLSPEARHAIEAHSDDAIVLNLAIRQSTFLSQFSSLPRRGSAISGFFMDNLYARKKLNYLLIHTGGDEVIRNLILQMCAEHQRRDPYTDDILTASMTILFNLLLRHCGDRMETPPLRRSQSAVTDAMLGYIHDHYMDVTLQKLADEFHFSRQYCSRLISELTGCSFTELLTRIRIGAGEDLLANTFLSVDEIGERLGYSNPETFIRAFQRVKGVTPGQYRRALVEA